MTDIEQLKTMIRRNTLLGLWAAEKLGLAGDAAEAYSSELAMGALDGESIDVFAKIRMDFDGAGVAASDAEILRLMEEFTLQASGQRPTRRKDAIDAAAVLLARKLST
jgi:hypothetical protein